MTIEKWGSIGELIGALATVATLLYLALQIRENTRQTKREALNGVLERTAQWQARRAGSPEMINAWLEGQKSFHELSEADKLRFEAILAESLAIVESTLEADKYNTMKDETTERVAWWVREMLEPPGCREWWETKGKLIFSRDYAEYVNELLNQ